MKLGNFLKQSAAKAARGIGGLRYRVRKLSASLIRTGASPRERAQVIVVFVISLFALMVLMTLILDGGMLLLRKREAQASADSGALAGVVYLCGNTPDFIAAANAAQNYAVAQNQATFIDPPTFPGGGDQIQVIAHITQSPALAGLLGFGDITVEALAIAQCQSAGSGTSLMPFVFVCEPPGIIESDSEKCLEKIWEPDNPEGLPAEYSYYYLVHNSDPADENLECLDEPNSDPNNPDPPEGPKWTSGAMDCDWDDDGIDDIIDSANRAWISLESGQGVGAATLIDWIANGFDGEIPIHLWVAGAPGVANSVFSAVEDLEAPDFPIVLVPIFDDICNFSDPEVDCAPRWHDDSTPPDSILILSGHQKYYHIIGFAGFQITCVHNTGNDSCPFRQIIDDASTEDWLGQALPATIEGYFVSVVSSNFGVGAGADTGAYITRLIR